ncbi:site-specific integrase [Tahibacter amnicola]|uniref:Site-specific integrase n=1 Tax=Tahibacter amnicola TaxID=2976241 RepID=A0ABY6BDR3_9GAMM|nr:site-specific integrase [Tahibacter amnicola]UXI66042.1 site-specific integrase [Tahibacter amnicola]
MADVQKYLDAATRENTRQSYASAVRHFEEDWGGHLPTHADGIARYLAAYAEDLSVNTLRQRLAALARWHAEHGYLDPTRSALVRQTLRGIQALHPVAEKQAAPLQLSELGAVADWLDTAAALAEQRQDVATLRRCRRDRALILLGFWKGFRGDELTRLRIEHLTLQSGEGLSVYLPRSKTDRSNAGTTARIPALSRWCPVSATETWLALMDLPQGPLFPKIDRWGTLGSAPLNIDSVIPVLRRALTRAGVTQANTYSGHSLRRGFASWANANGWDIKSLMQYVGWRKVDTAMRYVDADVRFAKAAIELGVGRLPQAVPELAPPRSATPAQPVAQFDVRFALTSYTESARRRAKARRLIEEVCMARHRGHREDADGLRFRIQVADDSDLDDVMATLLDDMYRIADNNECYLEAVINERDGKRHWE